VGGGKACLRCADNRRCRMARAVLVWRSSYLHNTESLVESMICENFLVNSNEVSPVREP